MARFPARFRIVGLIVAAMIVLTLITVLTSSPEKVDSSSTPQRTPEVSGTSSEILNKLLGVHPSEDTSVASVQSDSTTTPSATIATPHPQSTRSATPVRASNTPPPPSFTPTQTPALIPGATQANEIDGMVILYVPAGQYLIGSPEGTAATFAEVPPHKVFLDAFWIDQTEVTNAMYGICAANGVCQPLTDNPYLGNSIYEDYPVVAVTWHDAMTYCKWAGRRLPSEAEWEAAARGPNGRTFPWGNESAAGNRLNFCDRNCQEPGANTSTSDGYIDLAPVGTYPEGASPFGALDMAGNVWEWVADWWDGSYYEYTAYDNPTGPASGEYRVYRGGSWRNGQADVRSSLRTYEAPERRRDNIGFRCARG